MKLTEVIEDISKEERYYKCGFCDAFALALNKKFGYPLYIIRGYWYDKEEEEWVSEAAHAIVKSGKKYIDVSGFKSKEYLINNSFFNNPIEKVKIEPISIEEMKYSFTTEGVSEEEIKKAIKFIEKNIERYRG